MVPVILKFLPELPRFLLKVGKVETVRTFVEDLEKLSGVPHDEQLIDPAALKVLEYSATRKLSIFDLFRPPYLQRCVIAFTALLSPFVTFYVITIYGPTIIQRMGASPQNALYYTSGLLFLTVITTAVAGSIGDRISRRWGLAVIMTITALGTIALGMPLSTVGVVVAAVVVWGCDYAGFPLAKLYMAEQFPTRLRGSGSMLGESITRFLGGVVLVYLFPILDAQLGQGRLFVILGILTEICILPILLFGFQTSGISVEQTGTDVNVATTDIKASPEFLDFSTLMLADVRRTANSRPIALLSRLFPEFGTNELTPPLRKLCRSYRKPYPGWSAFPANVYCRIKRMEKQNAVLYRVRPRRRFAQDNGQHATAAYRDGGSRQAGVRLVGHARHAAQAE